MIEVKYLRKSTKGKTIKSLDLKREQEKMRAEKFQGDRCALLIFGHGDAFGEEDELPKGMEVQEWLRGRTSIFELGNRKYAARYFYKRSECASANKIAEA